LVERKDNSVSTLLNVVVTIEIFILNIFLIFHNLKF